MSRKRLFNRQPKQRDTKRLSMTMQAIYNGRVVAQSDDTAVIEGNHYFPRASVDDRFLVSSTKTTQCPWKGTASYFTVEVGEKQNRDGAWYYPSPKPAADAIADRVAFGRGIDVVAVEPSDAQR